MSAGSCHLFSFYPVLVQHLALLELYVNFFPLGVQYFSEIPGHLAFGICTRTGFPCTSLDLVLGPSAAGEVHTPGR